MQHRPQEVDKHYPMLKVLHWVQLHLESQIQTLPTPALILILHLHSKTRATYYHQAKQTVEPGPAASASIVLVGREASHSFVLIGRLKQHRIYLRYFFIFVFSFEQFQELRPNPEKKICST